MWESEQCGLGVHPKVIGRTHMCKPDMVAHTHSSRAGKVGASGSEIQGKFQLHSKPKTSMSRLPNLLLACMFDFFVHSGMDGWWVNDRFHDFHPMRIPNSSVEWFQHSKLNLLRAHWSWGIRVPL